MDNPSQRAGIDRRRAALAVLVTAAALVSACGSRPWLTDDLLTDHGRFYTTCEDPANEQHEKEVWLTPEQAATHVEGQPCPDGPLRTGEYWQAPGADDKRITITRPARPTTSSRYTALSTTAPPPPATKTTAASKTK